MKNIKKYTQSAFRVICLLSALSFFSGCTELHERNKRFSEAQAEKKYRVRYSGSHYDYYCDSVIWITDKRLQLKNNGEIEPFVEILINSSDNVWVRLNK